MLGAGRIMVQRYGDILSGKRTWPQELARANVRPTLKDAVAGDITAAMPYRAMVNIIEFIKMVDHVVPVLPRRKRCSIRPNSSSTPTKSAWTPTSRPTSAACTASAIPPAGPAG